MLCRSALNQKMKLWLEVCEVARISAPGTPLLADIEIHRTIRRIVLRGIHSLQHQAVRAGLQVIHLYFHPDRYHGISLLDKIVAVHRSRGENLLVAGALEDGVAHSHDGR